MSSRVAPHDAKAEQGLIGACLVSYRALEDAAVEISPEDFYQPAHAGIWAAMLAVQQRGERPDMVTVASRMRQDGTWQGNTEDTLIGLMSDAPSAGQVGAYCRILREHARVRVLLSAAHEIEEMIYDPAGLTSVELAERAEVTFMEAAKQRSTDTAPVSLAEAGSEWLMEFERQRQIGSDGFGLRTGLYDLDARLAGLRGGQLVTVAARPGAGKSQLLAQIAMHVACHSGPVLFCSLEMKRREIAERIIAAQAGISLSSIRIGRLTKDEVTSAVTQVAEFDRAQMWFVDQPRLTVAAVHAQARRLRAKHGLALVVVDYLQLMAPPQSRDNRQVEVSAISGALKELAMDLDIPVVSAAQLNRLVEYRSEKKPMLADLRESGAIEQDSDVVIAIHRAAMYDDNASNLAELLVLKQRSGATGTVDTRYDDVHGLFVGVDHHHDERSR